MKAADDLAEHIRTLEEKMLESSFRKSSREFAELLTDDFVEFGSSGRVFDKAAILRELSEESPAELSLRDFAAARLAEGVVQATYVSMRETPEGVIESLRCSIWVLRGGVWKIRFHQGTRIPPIA
jgi:hypothetical protein